MFEQQEALILLFLGQNIFTCSPLLNDFESEDRVSINKFAKMPHTQMVFLHVVRSHRQDSH